VGQSADRVSGWGAVDQARDAVLRRRFPLIEDLRRRARRRIPKFAFDFLDGGAGSDAGVRRNAAALEAIALVPRYGIAVEPISTEVELFGRSYAAPVGIAPMVLPALTWPGAEEYLAPAAERARIPYVLASVGSATIERVAALAPETFWFQLYRLPRNDHAVGFDLMRRAEAAGAHVLVLTIDGPVRSKRARDLRNALVVPFRPTLRTVLQVAVSPAWLWALRRHGPPRFENFVPYAGENPSWGQIAGFAHHEVKGSYSWEEIARIRDRWRRPLVLKGILHPNDAERAAAVGADGVWVSNHGGRHFDAAPAAIDMLPAVVAAAGSRVTVLMDSGIRSGVDVVRALALGAKAAFAGRPFLYGLAALGPEGARHVVDMLVEETRLAFGHLGVRSPAEVDKIEVQHSHPVRFAL
jgi:(S)-mandelate dehydrogenase